LLHCMIAHWLEDRHAISMLLAWMETKPGAKSKARANV